MNRNAYLLTLGTPVDTDVTLRADGTRWDHAAVMGTFYYDGEEFTIDEDVVQSFVANFKRNSPCKVPVDYDHSSTNGTPGKGHPVPKAGTVVEMAGIFKASELTEDMLAKVKRLGRDPGDARNFGLWIRWKPTVNALGYVKSEEYTELSIAFSQDYSDPTTGKGQGPTVYAVALTNTPFLNEMVSIAASRSAGGDPADSGDRHTGGRMAGNRFIAALSAALGRPVDSEEQGAEEAARELTRLKSAEQVNAPVLRFGNAALAILGLTSVEGAEQKLRELKSSSDQALERARQMEEQALGATVDAGFKKIEDRVIPAERDVLKGHVLREMKDGKLGKVEDSPTYKVLAARKPHGIAASRNSAVDTGEEDISEDYDEQIEVRSQALLTSDARLKALAERDPQKALEQAQQQAEKEMRRDHRRSTAAA